MGARKRARIRSACCSKEDPVSVPSTHSLSSVTLVPAGLTPFSGLCRLVCGAHTYVQVHMCKIKIFKEQKRDENNEHMQL